MKCRGKNRYRSERMALHALFKCWMLRNAMLRVYRCPHCSGWHLTSQEKR